MRPLDKLLGVSLREDIPEFRVGDSLTVAVRIVEGDKEKLQDFEGVVIARRGAGLNETLVVRKISYGEGVERTFYLNSPNIKTITLSKKGKARRATLYYLRGKIGKKSKIKEMPETDLTKDKNPAAEGSIVTNE